MLKDRVYPEGKLYPQNFLRKHDPTREPDTSQRKMTTSQIENTFTYHRPFGDQANRYEEIRNSAKALAHVIQDSCPESREKALALTNMQQAVMWANASIAINEKPLEGTADGA